MPLPLAAIGALAAGGGAALNSGSTIFTNFAQQKHNRKMYELQKRDSLAFWHLQNQYNSPEQQMQRLKSAGLNPNLVYGQSSGAASGQASQISTPDVQNTQYRDPQFGNSVSSAGLAYLSAITDIEIKQAQVDNLRAQNQVIRQEYELKSAYTNRSKFDLEFESELRGTSAEARRERLRQLKTSTDISINEDIRRALLTTSNLQQAAERVATMRQQQLSMAQQRAHSKMEMSRIRIEKERLNAVISNTKMDTILKEKELELRKAGINPNDPMWARIAGRVLADFFGYDESDDIPSIMDFFTKRFK